MKLALPVRRKHVRIEIIPLIDIMFFLLAAFMMVSLQLDRAQNIRVDLPQASTARQEFKSDLLNIAVDKAGHPFVEKNEISMEYLALVVSNRLRANTNLPVHISADRETLNGAMSDVYQVVRNAGVQDIAFMVTEPEAERRK
jgi:biopolymer transport protein ExbD